jgi:hypothetical protein
MAGSSELQKHLGYPSPDFDLIGYAIRNLGFILVSCFRNAMRIRANLGSVARRTVASAIELTMAGDYDRFAFEVGVVAPSVEIIGNLNDAIARLEDLLEATAQHDRPAAIVCEELSLGRLRHPKRAHLCRLIKEWKRTRGRLPRHLLAPFEETGVAERTVLTRTYGDRGARIEFFGPRLDVFDPGWSARAIGLDLEDQPDPIYGIGTARGYHEVQGLERPRLELVDAVINAPGRPRLRSRYERLLLPWKAPDGTVFVSGASLLRTRFSIGASR